MKWTVLDFETCSGTELKTHGLDNYVNDPEFDAIICAAMDLDSGEIRASEMPEEIKEHLEPMLLEPSMQFIAFNAMFEYEVACALARRWGIPEPAMSRFHCASAQALAMGFPSALESVGQILFKEGKNPDGAALIKMFCKKQKGKWTRPCDAPVEWSKFVAYAIQDIRLTARVWTTLPKLSDESRLYWLSVGRMNKRGFKLDLPAIQRVLNDVEMIKADSDDIVKAVTKGIADRTTQGDRIKGWMQSQGFTADNLQAETVRKWLDDPDLDDDVRELLQARLKGSKSTFGKYLAFKRFAGKDGRNRHGFWFWGAHTGRLSGKGSQPQNIAYDKTETIRIDGRPASPEQVLDLYLAGKLPKEWERSDALVAMTRAVIACRTGKKLYIVDQSAIEARIVCWLAGHDEFVEAYARGEDLYRPMAAFVLGKSVDLVTKEERNTYGKPPILACGYGMGVDLFASKYKLTKAMAQTLRDAYRKKYYKVKQYWDRLQDAFRHCLTRKEPTTAGKVLFRYQTVGDLNFVVCTPPGGRHIWYRNPSLDKKGDLYFEREKYGGTTYQCKIWGGTMLENIAQNIAGYILTHGTFNIERLLALPVLQIHDELVCEVEPDADIAALDRAMVDIPRLDGLPLAVESKLAMRFGK